MSGLPNFQLPIKFMILKRMHHHNPSPTISRPLTVCACVVFHGTLKLITFWAESIKQATIKAQRVVLWCCT